MWDQIVDHATHRAVVVVLDEVPYLIDGDTSFAAQLQRSWDRARQQTNPTHLVVILTGSALSTIHTVTSSGGALYGRPDRQLRLDPFDLNETATYLHLDGATAIEALAATGGYPLLLDRWSTTDSTRENLLNLATDGLGPLVANATSLLLDLPEAPGFRRTLYAIGRGASRHSEITNHAGQRIDRTLSYLERAGLARRVTPIGESRSATPRHEVADTYLRFWFAVIERDLELIEGGQGRAVLQRALTRWQTHVADVFENEAREHMVRLVRSGELPSDTIVGRWWTDRPRQVELDVVAVQGRTWVLVGEAKWSDAATGRHLRELHSKLVVLGDRARRAQLAYWARRSFTPDFVAAAGGTVRRYTADDMLA